jgi:cytochrome c oxidase cbb3-type subunit 2
MSDNPNNDNGRFGYFKKIEFSAVLTVIGIFIMISGALGVTYFAPLFVEKEWTVPSSFYQMQMYEVADPNFYISNRGSKTRDLLMVNHLREGFSLLAFQENDAVRIIAPPQLEQYITRHGDPILKLTSHLMLLRSVQESNKTEGFKATEVAAALKQKLQSEDFAKSKGKTDYKILELYEPTDKDVFSIAETDGILENWIDKDFKILDTQVMQPYHQNPGVIYINNPKEFRIKTYKFDRNEEWMYDPKGELVTSLQELKGKKFGFLSRKELIYMGEDVYRIEGCWYCHTDQTRTLIQDVVLNGSESEPAPPSTPNEYVYNNVTFPGTRRIGPDLSRVGIKRPSRDWHKGHFWSPKTASQGSIMPSFRSPYGVPNYQFEAIFQYLMTKGTRITAPSEAWWLGKDPVQTKAIIEGRLKVAPKNE